MIYSDESNFKQPYHSMIYLGNEFRNDGEKYVVYHTGSDNEKNVRGIVKIISIKDLMQHSSKNWQPVSNNQNFKGFYRWKILD